MFDLNKILRKNIVNLKPYSSARDEYSREASIFLDANENSFGSVSAFNHSRYPDPLQKKLKQRISEIKDIPSNSIFVGNGSDEAIDLLIRMFCEPGKDNILTFQPSYGMYKVSADINNVGVTEIPLNKDFSLNKEAYFSASKNSCRIVFICSPNNPSGNSVKKEDLLEILNDALKQNIVVVIDEAYIDFCPEKSLLSELKNFPNLVIVQTFSKAWGLAELRLGMAFASREIVAVLNKVKPPYNVNGVSQTIAISALQNKSLMNNYVSQILDERRRLSQALGQLEDVIKVHPSDSNFLLVEVKDAEKTYDQLLKNKIVVRNRSNIKLCNNCLRITVGTPLENDAVLQSMAAASISDYTVSKNNDFVISKVWEPRIAEIKRKTSETDIKIKINLDGNGRAEINTGLGFFDHMLHQIARHGGFDLSIECHGDLKVDEHHTVEDTALALGEAVLSALGDKKGIERYGFLLPMDDSLAQVALDFSGRNWIVWEAEFKRERVGDLPTELFFHFFKSFSDAAKCNLNIKVSGDNEHHKIESIFKAFARALKMAVKRDLNSNEIPSTKGTL